MLSILLSDHSNWTFFEFLVTLQIFLGRRSWIKIFGMFGIRGHQSSVQLVVHEAYVYQSRGRMMMAPSWGVQSFSDDDLGLALAHTGYQQRCCGFNTSLTPSMHIWKTWEMTVTRVFTKLFLEG